MSYRIEYGYQKKYKTKPRFSPWISVAAIVMVIGVGILALQYVPWNALLPGDPKVTGEALDRLVSGIENGESIAQAFSSFCQEIVAHANLPQ